MNIFEYERNLEIEDRPFLSVKHMQAWNEIVTVASKIFIKELQNIEDDRDLAVVLGFTAKICEKIDSFQTINNLTVPKAQSWFNVIWSWLKNKKTI